MGQGASLGEEAVLADSGQAGEVIAGVGRVRSLAFLNSLLVLLKTSKASSSHGLLAITPLLIIFQFVDSPIPSARL